MTMNHLLRIIKERKIPFDSVIDIIILYQSFIFPQSVQTYVLIISQVEAIKWEDHSQNVK
jgi:hypothetical protein